MSGLSSIQNGPVKGYFYSRFRDIFTLSRLCLITKEISSSKLCFQVGDSIKSMGVESDEGEIK